MILKCNFFCVIIVSELLTVFTETDYNNDRVILMVEINESVKLFTENV